MHQSPRRFPVLAVCLAFAVGASALSAGSSWLTPYQDISARLIGEALGPRRRGTGSPR